MMVLEEYMIWNLKNQKPWQINDNETLGNYCAKLGAPFSITTETPVINTSINKRVDAQVSMIAKFVEYDGTV